MKYFLNLLLLALVAALHAAAAAPSRPNILYLLADDLGYADLGVQGCDDVPTPNLDSIAENGVRFTSGYVSAPVCSPSRAGLITGRYQTRFGHEFNHPMADRAPVGLPVTQKTAANWFKEAGYTTAHIGKRHLGNPNLPQYPANARGFDDDISAPGQNKLPPLTLWRNGQRETADDRYVDLAMGREDTARLPILSPERRKYFGKSGGHAECSYTPPCSTILVTIAFNVCFPPLSRRSVRSCRRKRMHATGTILVTIYSRA